MYLGEEGGGRGERQRNEEGRWRRGKCEGGERREEGGGKEGVCVVRINEQQTEKMGLASYMSSGLGSRL